MIKVMYPNYRETEEEVIKFHRFSGGEVHVNLKERQLDNSNIMITARLSSSENILELLVLTDALKRLYTNKIDLTIPYLPYSRQDRVCVKGDSFSLKVFANLINSMEYNRVFTADAHSNAASLLINNLCEIKQSHIVPYIEGVYQYNALVSPDQGAIKKVEDIVSMMKNHMDIVYAIKKRDYTGEIIETTILDNNIEGRDLLIVDDICDGGRTFINLASKLKEKGANKIGLYVTHPIFSYGVEVLLTSGIDEIYTTDSLIPKCILPFLNNKITIVKRFF